MNSVGKIFTENLLVRRFFATLGGLGLYVVAFFLGLMLVFIWFRSNFHAPVDRDSKKQIYFEVKKNTNFEKISKEIESQGLVGNWWALFWLFRMREWDQDSAGGKKLNIIEGEYILSPANSPQEILDKLLSGEIEKRRFEITAGMSIRELPKLLVATQLATEKETNDALRDPVLMRNLGITHAIFPEGFVLPGKYEFARPITAKEIVSKLVTDGKKALNAEHKDWKKRSYELGFRQEEILTLASLIENETTLPEERSIVSSMYHNRLRLGIPLQSNAALVYGIPDFNGTISEEDRKSPGPYNTYLQTGLPPTPICSPSTESIQAALHPADTEYLYFVEGANGSHKFATTYKKYRELLKHDPIAQILESTED